MTFQEESQTEAVQPEQVIPYIVALSASEFYPELIQQCQEAGFVDWFTQPLKYSDVQTRIVNHIVQERVRGQSPPNKKLESRVSLKNILNDGIEIIQEVDEDI